MAILVLTTGWGRLFGQSALDLPADGLPADIHRLSKVFGTDNRQQVKDTTSFPWSAIGLIVSTWEERGTWVGTGALIGRQTVLTCGHNVCDPTEGWADSILFIPGKNGIAEPFGRIAVTRHFAWDAWIQKGDSQSDIAVLILASPIGDQTGQMDFVAQPAIYFSNRLLNSAGYPADLATEYGMYSASATAREVDDNLILHTLDTTAGQSGSPVWDYDSVSRARTIVGVMRGSRTTSSTYGTAVEWNTAVRITDTLQAWIDDLLSQYDGDLTPSARPGTRDTTSSLTGRSDRLSLAAPACGSGIMLPLTLAAAVLPLLTRPRPPRRG